MAAVNDGSKSQRSMLNQAARKVNPAFKERLGGATASSNMVYRASETALKTRVSQRKPRAPSNQYPSGYEE